jgi:hypothetical protein
MGYYSHLTKDLVKVVVRTTNERIEGHLAKMPGGRLLDLLNTTNEKFVAVTDASVHDAATGKLMSEVKFLAVNKEHIIYMFDETETKDTVA